MIWYISNLLFNLCPGCPEVVPNLLLILVALACIIDYSLLNTFHFGCSLKYHFLL